MEFKRLMLIIVLLLSVLTAGCNVRSNEENKVRPKVTSIQVSGFQNQKAQKRVDIYIPLKEQYATSNHIRTLEKMRANATKIKASCYRCHSAEGFLMSEGQEIDSSQINNSITCIVCHELDLGEFKLRKEPLEICTECHSSGSNIKPGQIVRHNQKEMFLGVGAIGVSETPDHKYLQGLTCIECHMPNESHAFEGKTPSQALQEHSESICIMCHADQSEEEFAQKVDNIQAQIRESIDKLDLQLNTAKEKIDRLNNAGYDMTEIEEVYNVIYTDVCFIKADKSMGVHNFDYSRKIINYCEQRYRELNKLLAKK